MMKRYIIIFIIVLISGILASDNIHAQCSICSKTTQQMGEKPAKGFNSGIIYLMLTPLGIMGYLGYRWWKGEAR